MSESNGSGALVGLFFQADSGWQGQVINYVVNGFYVVQLYEWVMGNPSVQRVVHLEKMSGWDFYVDADDWRRAGNERGGR